MTGATGAGGASSPKAHHYIPASHLARFGSGAGPVRARAIQVFDKRAGTYRSGSAGKLAFENDLYTFRQPPLPDGLEGLEAVLQAVRDAANKDAFLEHDKAAMEERGLRALVAMEAWTAGERTLDDSVRVPVLAYVALLLAQHPSMMMRRAREIEARFWKGASGRLKRSRTARRLVAEMVRGFSVLAMIPDQLLTALELNYLGWKVVRWPTGPRLILGDSAVVATYPGNAFGVGDVWTPGARFYVPLSPGSALFLGDYAPGVCFVEERTGPPSRTEVTSLNVVSWVRARSEVYAMSQEDLTLTSQALGPFDPKSSMADQLLVRQAVLPGFRANGPSVDMLPPLDPMADDTAGRFRARMAT